MMPTVNPENLSKSLSVTTAGGTAAETPAHRKLRKAAQEFESILISDLWKDFGTSFGTFAGEAQPVGSDTLNSLAIETISTAMAQRGGLGIAQMLVQKLAPCLNRRQTGSPEEEIKIASRG
jgi:Rod binding domain-containing protein